MSLSFLRPSLLQPLSWIFLVLALTVLALGQTVSPSDSPLGVVIELNSGLSSLLMMASLLCSSYAPQSRHLSSPKLKRYLLGTGAFVLVMVLAAARFQMAHFEQERAHKAATLELERDIAKVQLEIKQLQERPASAEQMNRLEAKIDDLQDRFDRLKRQH